MSTTAETYRFEPGDGFAIVVLSSEANDRQFSDIEKLGSELIGRLNSFNQPACVIDLSQLKMMGSALVALLVRVWKNQQAHNAKMAIVSNTAVVREVLQIAGLDKVWTIVDSREAAIKALGIERKSPVAPESSGMVYIGLLAAIAALAGFAVLRIESLAVRKELAVAAQFLFAALGLIVGTVSVMNDTGRKRFLGAGVVVACFAIIVLATSAMIGALP